MDHLPSPFCFITLNCRLLFGILGCHGQLSGFQLLSMTTQDKANETTMINAKTLRKASQISCSEPLES